MYYDAENFPMLDPSQWDGGYCSNDGQIVTAQDAATFADALERALPDIPDYGCQALGLTKGGYVFLANPDMHPFEYFSGAEKQHVVSFIQLCRKGSFEIW
jgi:hypothetical protein